MAIFSRRAIQQVINETCHLFTTQQIRRHVINLNTGREETIPTEWELVILRSFLHLGRVKYEPNLGGKSRPDLLFSPRSTEQPSAAIEITAVSDKNSHLENPFEALWTELARRVSISKAARVHGGFHLNVRAASRGVRGRGRTRLALPRQQDFSRFIFGREFDRFLEKISASPHTERALTIKNSAANLEISFRPGARFTSASLALYTAAHSKTSNPVGNSLMSKARQLGACGFDGIRGIVLCDGGCDLLHRERPEWSSYHAAEVIEEFLRSHPSVNFVLTLVVREGEAGGAGPKRHTVKPRLHLNPEALGVPHELQASLLGVTAFMPRPTASPQNVRIRSDWLRRTGQGNEGDSFLGGLTMTRKTLKISLRAVQEVLAGRRDFASFAEAHQFDQSNPFLRNLEEGRLISGVTVERGDPREEDDDWLVFTFGERDPAISSFHVPRRGS